MLLLKNNKREELRYDIKVSKDFQRIAKFFAGIRIKIDYKTIYELIDL